ncbi:F-box protein SKIP27-like [Cynara cardunculus var. scolymus]|uniref:F-box protein SKIP27-like n=1 Tax=Cynara cardunculus var. scolymus TaxID=59895 RepID=UPI000D6248BE|nr:F-box protein SKIP27-like [Cynara cardunculus var. scolymus]XP_024992638.1 F-box protein SKIP27-like [Cynara cardunculus var. scolymus]
MAMGKNVGLGLVKRTNSFGRKRILILNDIDSIDVCKPTKKQFLELNSGFCSQRSLLQALPQEILIKILCGVDHEDLKRLFHVSKPIREAALIAKKWHFEYRTPKKISAFRCSLNLDEFPSSGFEEIEPPNAPKQLRVCRSRVTRKNSSAICVSLFADKVQERPTNNLLMEMES